MKPPNPLEDHSAEFKDVTGVIVDREPTERGQVIVMAVCRGGRLIALTANAN